VNDQIAYDRIPANVTNQGVKFSVRSSAAWAPGVETPDTWLAWANGEVEFAGNGEPPVKPMSPMLRRRAGFLGKMALEAAYQCCGDKNDVPAIFCSRHGEAARAVELLTDLAKAQPLSPTAFGLSVHNATAGLFSIARGSHSNSVALAGGQSSVEYGVIEACGLLVDGAPEVLLVVYDCPLPWVYHSFQDCREQPFAWAWLIEPAAERKMTLTWAPAQPASVSVAGSLPGALEVWRFYLRAERYLERTCDGRQWLWTYDG
jgi:hypothetical protein